MPSVTPQQLIRTLSIPEDAADILAAVASRPEALTKEEAAALVSTKVFASEYAGKLLVVFGDAGKTYRKLIRKSDCFWNGGGWDFGWRAFP